MITDHPNKYNSNENSGNHMKITKTWHRNTEWANAAGKKMVPIDLLEAGLPQTFNYLKKKKNAVSAKHSKAECSKVRYAHVLQFIPPSSSKWTLELFSSISVSPVIEL